MTMGLFIIQEIGGTLAIPLLDSQSPVKQVPVFHGQLFVIVTFVSSYPISSDNLSRGLIYNSRVYLFQRELCSTLVLWDIHSYREEVS